MSAKPENERREEIVNRIATAAMVCVTPHLKHMISFNTLCEVVSAALPPLPQQGEPVAWALFNPATKRFRQALYVGEVPCRAQARRLTDNYLHIEAVPLYAAPPASQALAEPVAWPNDKPPPHWTPADQFDRHPKTAEAWDWREDGSGDERWERQIRRLNFAGDLADPRAPDQMALVLRKDLIDIKHRLLRQTALAGLRAEAQARVIELEGVIDRIHHGYRVNHSSKWVHGVTSALLSGSTPKPAGVELTEEVKAQPPTKPTRAQRDMLERAIRAPDGRALGTYGVRQMAGGAKRRMFNAMQACGWFDRDGAITASGRAALTAALSGDA